MKDVHGRWALARRVQDRRTGEQGTVRGVLDVGPDGWFEQGELSWGGRCVPVTRRLGTVRHGDEWWLTFADGSLFHPWRPGVWVEHPCRADLYRGLVDVTATRMRILWDVTGPAKHQRLVTRLRRL